MIQTGLLDGYTTSCLPLLRRDHRDNRRESTVRISLRGHLIKDPPLGRGGTVERLQSDLIRSELE